MSKKTRDAFRQQQGLTNRMATPRVPEERLENRVPPALEALGAKPVEPRRIYVEDGKCPACGCPTSRLFKTQTMDDGRITWRGCRSCLHEFQGYERTWRKK